MKTHKVRNGILIGGAAALGLVVPSLAASINTSLSPGHQTNVQNCTTQLNLSAPKSPSVLSCTPKTTTTTTKPPATTTTTKPPATTTTTKPPTTTTTTPPTTTTTQPNSGNCTNPSFKSSDATGTDSLDDAGLYWVDNDAWNGSHGPQTLNVCSASSWYVTSQQTNNQGQVETYPNTEYDVGGRNTNWANSGGKTDAATKPLSAYTSITSSFNEAFPTTGDSMDAGYDLWTNDWSNETMIWNQYTGTQTFWSECALPGPNQNDCGDYVGQITLAGASYHVLNLGGEVIFVRDVQVSSGTVDILGAFQYEEVEGLAKASDAPTQLEYGTEICSTTGTQTFPLTGLTFSLS